MASNEEKWILGAAASLLVLFVLVLVAACGGVAAMLYAVAYRIVNSV